MHRTALVGTLAGALLAWNWLRLEDGSDTSAVALLVVLAIVPALLPGLRLRVPAAAASCLLAGASAFELAVGPALPGRVLSRFGRGVAEFYDVQVPFDPAAHARMHGVLLMAVFAFTLLVTLAAASRRAGPAALGLVVGVGWPATLLPGHDLLRGALLLAVVLALVACLRASPLRGPAAVVATGGLVVLVAVAAASSPALAKRAFLDWQRWDFYTRPAKPVDVSYAWDSNYGGLTFPRKRTTVLRIHAPSTPQYWRVTTLDAVVRGRWIEDTVLVPDTEDTEDRALVPRAAYRGENLVQQHVTVAALRDHRLAGASVPISFDAPELGPLSVQAAGAAYASRFLRRGDEYDVWSYEARPTPEQLVRSKAVYPDVISLQRKYLEVEQGVYLPPFGKPGRTRAVAANFASYSRSRVLRPYRPLYVLAQKVAGDARSPYAAAVALERWFRTGGGFVYDQHPPQGRGVPPLVDFVARHRHGYCQHFAGAMALMLRYLGVPARVAAGFTSGRYRRGDGEWIVSDHDAHTWVEVWFRGWGWLPFDPTPDRGGVAGKYSSSSPQFDVAAAAVVLAGKAGLGAFDQRRGELGFGARGADESFRTEVVPLGPSPNLSVPRRSRVPSLFTLLVLVALGLAVAIATVKAVVRRSRYLTRDPRRLAAACRKELRDFLLDQRVAVPPSATLCELAALLEREFGLVAAGFGLHATAARFGPRAAAIEAARAMRDDLRDLRRRLRRELTLGERTRGLVSLRSLGLTG